MPAPAWGQREDVFTLNQRGLSLFAAGRYTEAEPIFRRAVVLAEQAFGAAHLNTAATLYSLGDTYYAQGRYAEAEPLFRRALAIREKAHGPSHPETAASLLKLGAVSREQGRYAEAEPLFLRGLAIVEKVRGLSHPETATSLLWLASVYSLQGRYAEAEPLCRRALAIREKARGPRHPETAASLLQIGGLYEVQGRYAEAEPLVRRAHAIMENALGPEHRDTIISLHSLASLYQAQGRLDEAEPLNRRALELMEKVLGPRHPVTAVSLNNLAVIYEAQGRYIEAEQLHKRAVAVSENVLGPDHDQTALSLDNLAAVYVRQGRFGEAEPLQRRALDIRERVLGPDHPAISYSLSALGASYTFQRRYPEAQFLFARALVIRDKVLGPEHPVTAFTLAKLGDIKFKLQDWLGAYEFLSRASAIHIRSLLRSGALTGLGGNDRQRVEIDQYRWTFGGLIQAAAGLAKVDAADRGHSLADEAFTAAQWAQHSEAATALAAMAARFAKGDSALATLVRRRQDLVADYRNLDKLLVAASSRAPAERNAADEAALRAKIDAAGKQTDALDRQLKQSFPEYASLASPEPLTIAETQKHLGDDEALYQVFVDDQKENDRIYAWLVTKNGARFQQLNLSATQMAEHVEALRCGLDASRWTDERGLASTQTGANTWRKRCEALLGDAPTERLPFDLRRAHALYQSLFAPFADLIKGKRLLIVADGALTALPIQVLVTASPDESLKSPLERYRKASWLVAEHVITVLPSVSSLKALRGAAGRSAAPRAYAAFANPLLTGYTGNDRRAWSKVACPPSGAIQRADAGAAAPPRGTLRSFFRGGLADAEALARQPALPETADEVCVVAASLDAGFDAVLLGARITETAIKAMSRTGELKLFRTVHFATHGLIATETRQIAAGGLAEPGLIMTPPAKATENDDGLLTASEVAQLDLNADLVILSACNTAAGDGTPHAQALSGLTRAFLYAGARALLVSHWAVDTYAAVDLVTGTFATLRQEPGLGRAEALRRAMLAQIARGGRQAHPSYWAPFVIVGEGR